MKRLFKRVSQESLIGRDITIGGGFVNFPIINHAKCKILNVQCKDWFTIKIYHLSSEEEDYIFSIPYNEICYIYPNFINENHYNHNKKIQELKSIRKDLIKVNEEIYYAKKAREELIDKIKNEKENRK